MRDKRLDGRSTAPHEFILIRVGHHLWRSLGRKEWPEKAILSGLRDVWRLKEEIRIPLRAEWLKYHEKRARRGTDNLRRMT